MVVFGVESCGRVALHAVWKVLRCILYLEVSALIRTNVVVEVEWVGFFPVVKSFFGDCCRLCSWLDRIECVLLE